MNCQLYNGQLLNPEDIHLSLANRGLMYGDGLFETIRLVDGKIPLWHHHQQRFFSGMHRLCFPLQPVLDEQQLMEQLTALCRENNCEVSARIRLMAWRGDGTLYDDAGSFGYAATCHAIPSLMQQLPAAGLRLGIFTGAQKSVDEFSCLKSSSFLPYVMAANYAKAQKIDDALLLNAAGKIADSTIANLFIVKSGAVYTPALSQGPVAGVMRNWLLLNAGIPVLETALTTDDLLQAEEIWLTNAVAGLRWVEYFEGRKYGNHFAQKIYQKILSLFS